MGRLRSLSRRIEEHMDEARGFVIGARGLEKPQSGIVLQPNVEYFMGASTSPDHIIVTKVTEEAIEYVNGPDYKRKLRMERWIAEDLIMRGTQMWLKRYGDAPYPWAKKTAASLRSLLKGGKGMPVQVADFYRVQATVEPVGKTRDEAWTEAERYGNVGGQGDTLVIDMRAGGVPALKKDKQFKVLKVEEL